MCNGMFALKTGNAVIFAPHPKAQKCTEHLTNEFMKIVKKHGGPDNLDADDQEGLGREDAGAHALRRRRRRHRRRRDGEVGVLVGQAVVRRRRRQRARHHRSRRRLQRRRRQDRHGRRVRQRHHLLARAVRADARRALRRDRQAVQGHRQGLVHRRRGADPEAARASCSPTAT